jgi:hypothetical protein
MNKRITRRRAAWLAVVPLATVVMFVLAGTSNAASRDQSRPLHGQMRNIVQHFGCPQAPVTGVCSTFEANGAIQGDGFVVVDTFPLLDPKALGYSQAHTVITTAKGDLHCHEAALFDLLVNDDHPFVDLCVIDGDQSTGDYQGAVGYIQEVGTFPGTVGSLDYYGKITLQHD